MSVVDRQSNDGAATDVPVHDVIARDLAGLGVSTAFGLMGDDTAKLVNALDGVGIQYRGARHENSAVAMAEGYAWATHGLGVCILNRGPGLTNGLTGIVNAARGGEAVLIVVGAPAMSTTPAPWGPDEKHLDAEALGAACEVSVHTPTVVDQLRTTLSDAVREAQQGRTTIYNVPVNLLAASVSFGSLPAPAPAAGPPPASPADADAIAAAAAALGQSRRPLILAGRGAVGAADEILALAERTGAVVGTTLRAKGMFPDYPYHVGVVGSFTLQAGRSLIDEVDLVLAIGAGMNAYTTIRGSALPAVPVIHVDDHRERIGRWYRADFPVVGDATLVAGQLLDALDGSAAGDKPQHVEEVRQRLADSIATDEYTEASTAHTIDPRTLVLELDALLPEERTIVSDVGNFFGFVPQHIRTAVDGFKVSSNFSAIGLGPGTAIGVAIARAQLGETTVLFVGDGSLLMTLGELETLVREDVPLVVVCVNDCAYGAERHYLELTGSAGTRAIFPDADFADVAAQLGIEGHTIRSVEHLRAVGGELGARTTPLVLDCKVNPDIPAPPLAEMLALH